MAAWQHSSILQIFKRLTVAALADRPPPKAKHTNLHPHSYQTARRPAFLFYFTPIPTRSVCFQPFTMGNLLTALAAQPETSIGRIDAVAEDVAAVDTPTRGRSPPPPPQVFDPRSPTVDIDRTPIVVNHNSYLMCLLCQILLRALHLASLAGLKLSLSCYKQQNLIDYW